MKKHAIGISGIILVGVLAGLLWLRSMPSYKQSKFDPTVANQATDSSPDAQFPHPALIAQPRVPRLNLANDGGISTPRVVPMSRAQIQALADAQEAAFQAAFTTPRNLYGIVVDENGKPLADADVVISANDRPYSEHGSQYRKTTDATGRFELLGKPAESFYVSVSKTGYWQSQASSGTVNFAINDSINRPPTRREHPAKFVLKKAGSPAPLVMVKRFKKMLRDGTPYELSLTTGKQTELGQGDFRVEAWTYDQQKFDGTPYYYKYRISIPDGGLIEREGELAYEAPEQGYTAAKEYDRNSEKNGKPGSAQKEFFVKTRAGNYARIEFKMVAGGDNFFVLTSYLNATGSRNLEPTL